ncbi:CHAT domain-containing protein [Pinibacter aurantiacus]|uniref:CHAT domain-containing protein n=1 Tax=Pinibacter aurantiacus TaxID=2851599 RepID=A0A9E2S8A3_9BACT|nr:CHAT domain-containing protein [Pinibacter aurantiacus]MBV4356773.1 CHAT domain-containing protein [Pinibacter aurantiacus]
MTQLNPKQLIVKGELKNAGVSSIKGAELKASYQIGAATRGTQDSHAIDLDNPDHLLEFVFDDDSSWMCDAATLHELFPDVNIPNRAGEFVVPTAIANVDSERGIVGQAALKLLNVFVKKSVPDGVKSIAERLEDKLVGKTEGLCVFNSDFSLGKYQPDDKASDSPVLLFIHGTNSNTVGAYQKFKGSQVWDFMQSSYKKVLAFEHRTLTQSPLRNVLDLVKQLPVEANLHIISHSRGGLLGDIICRYSKEDDKSFLGFTDEHIRLLKIEGRDDDINCIKELDREFGKRKIKVKKFIRVACPAAGTRLASKRLDNIFNAFFNLLGGAANPVADILKELVAETVKTKEDANALPGIEAMSPDSPFVKVLNDRSDNAAIGGGSLAVISGNGKIGLSVKSFGIILGKLFFGQRNDLVVNTDSMYLGTRRNGNIQYFFDQGGDVNHFNYFFNAKTRAAINEALKADDGVAIPGFTSVNQYDVPASDRAFLGIEHGELPPFPNVPTGNKPIVVLLPGIMGSNLSKGKDKVWLNYGASLLGGLFRMERLDDNSITATSLIATSYKQLATRLSHNYDVVVYPFDWRKQLNECASDFNDKIVELLKYNQPIKIIGHSMGGVLVRDFIINHNDTWTKLNASSGFRLLYLGSPLGGSYRILTVLFGNDSIINSLNMLDMKHTKKELLTMFSSFPGILSLLPLTTDDKNDFGKLDTWKNMADALGDGDWPLPSKDLLDTFTKYRDNIVAKTDDIDYSNIVYIAGKDKATPSGYFNDNIPPRTELVFLSTGEGDQSVTWELGIPKKLDKKQVYYVGVSHGALANEPKIFDGIEQILANGSTAALTNERPVVRGSEQQFRMPVVHNFDLSERGVSNTILGISGENVQQPSQVPLSVSISCGCLDYASYHVLAGHFLNDGILYAEAAINNALDNNLVKRHTLGIYPGEIGTNTIVSGNEETDRISGAIIVGLGEPGKLTPYLLTTTVEKGILKHLLNINNKKLGKIEIGISTLMIGCGYGGLSIENSIKAIIEGVNSANAKMLKVQKDDEAVKLVQNLEFVELYEDKALSCLYTLTKIENNENSSYNIRIANRKIREMFGAQKNLISTAISEAWWNRVSVDFKTTKDIYKYNDKDVVKEVSSIVFNVSTGDAREEENEMFSSTPLIDLFIEQMSTQNNWNATYAKTLFELMIPNEFKQNLKKKGSILWVLDKNAASYPWELLQDSTSDAKPLCINAGMIRQLATTNYRADIRRASADLALIVADPVLGGFLPQLKGAEKEGSNVEKLLEVNNYNKISIIGQTAAEIIPALYSNEFKIIHLAGHGLFDPTSVNDSGMVIGKNLFLSVNAIKQMSTVPELVFVNCCHLGKVDAAYENYFANRYRLAANIGTELIEMGVKAVIAAGWAVADDAASEFAIKFYSEMLSGETFGEAVKKARGVIFEKFGGSNNTWGAYQCYGDPYYKLKSRTSRSTKKEEAPVFLIRDEAEIQLINLRRNLDTRLSTSNKSKAKLKMISAAVDKAEIRSGKTLEQEALIYYELGEYESAIVKFDLLRAEEHADFSVSALEKYCIAKAKKLVVDYKLSNNKLSVTAEIDGIVNELQKLSVINKTSERLNLIAETYKRKALVSKDKKEKLAAYANAMDFYEQAIEKRSDNIKALCNLMVLRISLTDKKEKAAADKKINLKYLRRIKSRMMSLANYNRKLDYWESMEYLWAYLSWIVMGGDVAKIDADHTWKGFVNWYKKNWKDAASKGKQLTEIENLEMLSDVIANSSLSYRAALKERVDALREGVEKLLLS